MTARFCCRFVLFCFEIFFLDALLYTPGLLPRQVLECVLLYDSVLLPSRQVSTIVRGYLRHIFCAFIFTNGFLHVLRQYRFLSELLSLLITFTCMDIFLLE